MNKIIKQNHIELSAGGTTIVSNENCPLTAREIIDLKLLVPVSENVETPCCICDAFVDKSHDITCPNYLGYVKSNKGEYLNCILIKT